MGGATYVGFLLCSPAPLCPYWLASTWRIHTPPTWSKWAPHIYSGCVSLYTHIRMYTCVRITHGRHETKGFSCVHLAVSNDNVRNHEYHCDICSSMRKHRAKLWFHLQFYVRLWCSAVKNDTISRIVIPFYRVLMTVKWFLKSFEMKIPR